MKKLLLLFLILINYGSYSQTINTYSGPLEGKDVNYQYYENDNHERIYHGFFQYKYSSYDLLEYEVKGNFKKNIKDGNWSFKEMNTQNGITTIINGSFLNGLRNGNWNMTVTDKNNKKVASTSITFNKGIPIGNYFSEVNLSGIIPNSLSKSPLSELFAPLSGQYSYKGKLNRDGFYDSTWVESENNNYSGQLIKLKKYRNGVLYWQINKSVASGKISDNFDSSKFVNSFFKQYTNSTKYGFVNQQKYGLALATSEKKEWFGKSFYGFEEWLKKVNPSIVGESYNQITYPAQQIIAWEITDEGKKEAEELPKKKKEEEEKERQIQLTKIENLKKVYQSYIDKADQAFHNKKYSEAITEYENALDVMDESYPKGKISEAKNIEIFLTERKQTIYNYPDYNKSHWNTIDNSMTQDIKKFLSKDDMIFKGTIIYTYNIDTLGKTSFSSSSEIASDISITNTLKNFGTKYSLEPVYKYEYTLNAKGDLKMNLSFDKNYFLKIVKRNNQITNNNSQYSSEIYSLLSSSPNGKYKVQIHQQKINDADFSENKIIAYKNIGGPSNACLSLLVPGLGNKFVSSNRKGLSIALITYGLVGAGIGAKFYSMSEYDKYHTSTTQSDMDKYYNNANYSNYAFYGLVTAGACYWIYDVYKVAKKGFENNRDGKNYKRQIGIAYNPNFNSFSLTCSIKY